MDTLYKIDSTARDALLESKREHLETAGRRHFIRECEAVGVDPTHGVSPSLLKIILSAG